MQVTSADTLRATRGSPCGCGETQETLTSEGTMTTMPSPADLDAALSAVLTEHPAAVAPSSGAVPAPADLEASLSAALAVGLSGLAGEGERGPGELELDPFADLYDVASGEDLTAESFRHMLLLLQSYPGLRITLSFG